MFLSLSLVLPFLKAVPLASLAELVWWSCILLDFCLVNCLFGLLFWLRALLGKVVLVAGLWFSLFGIFFAILFWLGAFPLRSQLLTLLGLPCMLLSVSPLLPLRISLCLWICHFNYDVSCSGSLWVPLAWDSLWFLDLCDFFSHQIREIFHRYFFKQVFFLFFLIFIVNQLQLCAFSPHPSTPPQVKPPPSPTSTLPLGFVHVSFIVVPENPSRHYLKGSFSKRKKKKTWTIKWQ